MHDTSLPRASRALIPFFLALAPVACAPLAPASAPAAGATAAVVTPAPVFIPAPFERSPEPVAEVAPAVPLAPSPQATPVTEATPRERVRATVLVYHMLNGLEDEMAITPAAFEEQMRWLVEHEVPVVPTSRLLGFLDGRETLPERAAVIQIDDGHSSAYAKAFPVLKRHGLPFTVALNTLAMDEAFPNTMSWSSVREMLSSGLCEVASHSHIHGHMDKLTNARNESEASLSMSIIEARTGVRPETFVFPFGANNERVRRTVADAGYRAAFEVGGIAARATSPRFKVPRVSVLHSMTLANFAKLFGDRGGVAKARPTTAAPKRG